MSDSFLCPKCKHNVTSVVDSRPSRTGVRRRRRCFQCETRFSTYEYAGTTPEEVGADGLPERQRQTAIEFSRLLSGLDPEDTSTIMHLARRLAKDAAAVLISP